VQRYLLHSGAPLLKATGPRVIHQHAAHQPGGDAEEMRPVLPAHGVCAGEPNKCFVDERRRLEGVFAPLPGHVGPSQAQELGLDEREQVLERLRIAVAPRPKQMGDLPRRGCRHGSLDRCPHILRQRRMANSLFCLRFAHYPLRTHGPRASVRRRNPAKDALLVTRSGE
jgi:hypothetical protein